ncbi:hypothetical protein Leryth_015291 [Lithospermum erythrorhizon]|nr:hypothetical protein Leryth_015291 [Lithospermum erythrorhizon]
MGYVLNRISDKVEWSKILLTNSIKSSTRKYLQTLYLRMTRDISPQAPTHIMIIPKVKDRLTQLSKAEERHCEILGRLLFTAKLIAKQEGLDDGFRIVINDGPNGCQSVYHAFT